MASIQSNPHREENFSTSFSQEVEIGPQEGTESVVLTAVTPTSPKSLQEKNPAENERHRSMTLKERAASFAYRNLTVFGFGTTTDYQKTFANYPVAYLRLLGGLFGYQQKSRIDILQGFEGVILSGEMLLVLGRPGSGCTTFLKTLAGNTHGLYVDKASRINYQGISPKTMHTMFRGDCTYQPESDVHFPHLTVAQTLDLAVRARSFCKHVTQSDWYNSAEKLRNDTVMDLGLQQTLDTKVGNSFERGISGGERKRTSIAEVLVGKPPLQCWDNSTRGLDSATALSFIQTLRRATTTSGSVAIVTLYQASQDIYDCFDKFLLLYEGRQIYFGSIKSAKKFFTNLGFVCPERSTTGEFLCSVTNPLERTIQRGHESNVPRTSGDFARIWESSSERGQLIQGIDNYDKDFPWI